MKRRKIQILLVSATAIWLTLRVEAATSRSVPSEALVEAAREYLLQELPWPPDQVKVQLVSKPPARAIPTAGGRVELRAKGPKGRKLVGRVKIVVTVRTGGKAVCEVPVLFDVRRVREIARRENPRGKGIHTRTPILADACRWAGLDPPMRAGLDPPMVRDWI